MQLLVSLLQNVADKIQQHIAHIVSLPGMEATVIHANPEFQAPQDGGGKTEDTEATTLTDHETAGDVKRRAPTAADFWGNDEEEEEEEDEEEEDEEDEDGGDEEDEDGGDEDTVDDEE